MCWNTNDHTDIPPLPKKNLHQLLPAVVFFFWRFQDFRPTTKSQKEMLRGTASGASGDKPCWMSQKLFENTWHFGLGKQLISRQLQRVMSSTPPHFQGLQPYTVCFFEKHEWLRSHHNHQQRSSYPTPLGLCPPSQQQRNSKSPTSIPSPFPKTPTTKLPAQRSRWHPTPPFDRKCLVVFTPRKKAVCFFFLPSHQTQQTRFFVVMFLKNNK